MLPAVVACSTFRLRPWTADDRAALVRHANSRAIWRNLWDAFPHPYTEADADRWLAVAAASPAPEGTYAIDVGGEAVGTVSLERGRDIERYSAEIGYWLGEAFWGRGLATEAVRAVLSWASRQSPNWTRCGRRRRRRMRRPGGCWKSVNFSCAGPR